MVARWYEHWREVVFPLMPCGRPRRFLEIGIGCGDTARFIGKHGKETIHDFYLGIDPWEPEGLRQRDDVDGTAEGAEENEKKARWQIKRAWGDKAEILKCNSVTGLARLRNDGRSFDLIHVDGLHSLEGVLLDSYMAWPLLANGGIMIWDDWGVLKRDHKAVKAAVETFTTDISGQYEELFRTRQYGVQKCQKSNG